MEPRDITTLTDQELLDATELLSNRMRADMRQHDLSGVRISRPDHMRRFMQAQHDKMINAASRELLKLGDELARRLREKINPRTI